MIQRIIIHKSTLDSFKRKAIKALPYETIVAIIGKVENNELLIYDFDTLNIISSEDDGEWIMLKYDQPEEEIEVDDIKYFGTLHTHPDATTEPSSIDIEDFFTRYNAEEYCHDGYEWEYLHDEIMGIMSIKNKENVIQYGLNFYNIDLKPIEIVISESKKGS
jgi:proteasome lid subunit RPN8/RPN11